MPIVARKEFWTNNPKAMYIVKISFGQRSGFTAALPKEITDRIGYLRLKSEKGKMTWDQIVEYIKRHFEAYDRCGARKIKVIAYSIFLTSSLPEPAEKPKKKYLVWGDDTNISYNKNNNDSVAINYQVLWKYFYEDWKYFYDEADEKLVSRGWHNKLEMDWTEKREAFFRIFKTGLQELALKIDQFINVKDISLEHIVDNTDMKNLRLLDTPGDKK